MGSGTTLGALALASILLAPGAARADDADSGPLQVEASIIGVAQATRGLPHGMADRADAFGVRGDLAATLTLPASAGIEHSLFAHVRAGYGLGLNVAWGDLAALAAAPNGVAFEAGGDRANKPVLGELFYRIAIPLQAGAGASPAQRLELAVGKMDFFGFFDQNAAANDEAGQFLNSVFVHNPLLDAGGETGADSSGFQPGVVLTYTRTGANERAFDLSVGVFGSGAGAPMAHAFADSLWIAQAHATTRIGELPGNVRVYAWHRAHADQLDGSLASHRGWGASLDQRINATDTVFARYGQLTQGDTPFRRTLTAGVEFGGERWHRGEDALGIAAAWLSTSRAYRTAGGAGCLFGDANGDGQCDAGDPGFFAFVPAGAERVAEAYYRFNVNKHLQVSPDLQYAWNMGGRPGAPGVLAFGLRAQLSY